MNLTQLESKFVRDIGKEVPKTADEFCKKGIKGRCNSIIQLLKI